MTSAHPVARPAGFFEAYEIIYTVDATDAITDVNDAWTRFAGANDGSALLPSLIVGRKLWDFIGEPTTTFVYRQLFERVRTGNGPVRFEFRCDSPAVRRLLRMTISAQPNGALRLVVRPVRSAARPEVRLLDPGAPRSVAIVRMCAWCKRIPDATGQWVEIEVGLAGLGLFEGSEVPAISHGMCDHCERTMATALDDPQLAASGSISLGGFPAVDLRLS